MKRWPPIPTLLVGLAVLAMLGLGIWQLQRKAEKEALIATYRTNLAKSPVAWPLPGAPARAILFRKTTVTCLRFANVQLKAGRRADGSSGWAVWADCATGAEGPGVHVELGLAPDPNPPALPRSARVSGWIVPGGEGLLARFADEGQRPVLVADTGLGGLATPAAPDPAGVPNNHLWYALQWFAFALAAAVIYVLALRRRRARPER